MEFGLPPQTKRPPRMRADIQHLSGRRSQRVQPRRCVDHWHRCRQQNPRRTWEYPADLADQRRYPTAGLTPSTITQIRHSYGRSTENGQRLQRSVPGASRPTVATNTPSLGSFRTDTAGSDTLVQSEPDTTRPTGHRRRPLMTRQRGSRPPRRSLGSHPIRTRIPWYRQSGHTQTVKNAAPDATNRNQPAGNPNVEQGPSGALRNRSR